MAFENVDYAISRKLEVRWRNTSATGSSFVNDSGWKFEVIRSRIDGVMNGQTKRQRKNIQVLYMYCMLLRNIYI